MDEAAVGDDWQSLTLQLVQRAAVGCGMKAVLPCQRNDLPGGKPKARGACLPAQILKGYRAAMMRQQYGQRGQTAFCCLALPDIRCWPLLVLLCLRLAQKWQHGFSGRSLAFDAGCARCRAGQCTAC